MYPVDWEYYYYVHDASGNPMAIYQSKFTESNSLQSSRGLYATEFPIYGQSRLGIYTPKSNSPHGKLSQTLTNYSNGSTHSLYNSFQPQNIAKTIYFGEKSYEISDYLGNITAVLSDKGLYLDNDTMQKVALSSSQDYYPFGMQMPGRSFSSENYRYGFGGHEKDDEISGNGNWYSFGDYGYMPRIGRRPSPDPVFRANMSGYLYGANNPIIFVDPEGTTEFYFNGKWVGTDGVDNNVIGVVRSPELKRSIVASTKQGNTFSVGNIGNGTKGDAYFGINADVLGKANSILTKQLKKKGKTGEFSAVMNQDGESNFKTTFEKFQSGDGVDGLPSGDVSIHGHPTGLDDQGRPSRADLPSLRKDFGENSDEAAFENFNTNIIVGNNGVIEPHFNTQEDGSLKKTVLDKRYPAINIFNNKSEGIGTIKRGEANSILNGDRGKLGKKFDKANEKKK